MQENVNGGMLGKFETRLPLFYYITQTGREREDRGVGESSEPSKCGKMRQNEARRYKKRGGTERTSFQACKEALQMNTS